MTVLVSYEVPHVVGNITGDAIITFPEGTKLTIQVIRHIKDKVLEDCDSEAKKAGTPLKGMCIIRSITRLDGQ